MIKCVCGVPGSGKSYFLIHQLVTKYFRFDDKVFEWVNTVECTIFTNLESLKLPHININDFCREEKITIEQFFTVPYFQKLLLNHKKIVVLIDEAQRLFPTTFKNTEVLYFFQYHRHLGVDIFLAFQDWGSITSKITKLCEFEIRAVRRTFSVVGEFRYHFYCGTEKIGGAVLKVDKRLFSLYQSFHAEGNERPANPVKRQVVILSLLFLALLGGGSLFLKTFFPSPSTDAGRRRVAAARSAGGPAPAPAGPPASGSPTPTMQALAVDPVVQAEKAFVEQATRSGVTQTLSVVQTGGMWVGKRLVAVQFFGELVPVERFPFGVVPAPDRRYVTVLVPDAFLAVAKPTLPDGQGNYFYPVEARYAVSGQSGVKPGGDPGDYETRPENTKHDFPVQRVSVPARSRFSIDTNVK